MSKANVKVNGTTNNIANLEQLQSVLGVKMERTRKVSRTLSEKAQIMKQVNETMHNLLIDKFPQYYKNIDTDIIVTTKEGEHKLQHISGYHLLFGKDITLPNGETQKGYAISKPTIYVKGGNSYSCLYYKIIGKTTNK